MGLKTLIYNHHRKLLIGGAMVGGAVLLSKYFRRLLADLRQKEMNEMFERIHKQKFFDDTQIQCREIAFSMLQELNGAIVQLFNEDELLKKLKISKLSMNEKLEIWDKLKVVPFAKISITVYACSLAMIACSLQMSLLGGYILKSGNESNKKIEFVTKLMGTYLVKFLEGGIGKLAKLIEEKVQAILEPKSLKEPLKLNDVEQIFWAIQTSISNDQGDPCKLLSEYIPVHSVFKSMDMKDWENCAGMIDDLLDLMESEEIINLTQTCVSRGFTFVMDSLSDHFIKVTVVQKDKAVKKKAKKSKKSIENFPGPGTSNSGNELKEVDVTYTATPLAKVIPLVSGLSNNCKNNQTLAYNVMVCLSKLDSLNVMRANIFETFCFKG